MNVRRMKRRLREVSARIKGRIYASLAALWPGPLDPEEQEQARRLFHWLVEQEVAARTPLEEILRRLPQGLAHLAGPLKQVTVSAFSFIGQLVTVLALTFLLTLHGH